MKYKGKFLCEVKNDMEGQDLIFGLRKTLNRRFWKIRLVGRDKNRKAKFQLYGVTPNSMRDISPKIAETILVYLEQKQTD